MIGGLSPRQAACLAFLRRYIADHGGASPSWEEVAAALGFTSRCSAHRVLVQLRERGVVAWDKRAGRSIVIVEDVNPYASEVLAALSDDTLSTLHATCASLIAERQRHAILESPTCPAMERRG